MAHTEEQFGKYSLERKLATGGMAEIFLARHVDQPPDTPPVALKRILPHHYQDPDFIQMFIREAKIVAELNHPNIIRIQDFGKEQGQYYMTMDYIDGVNLDKVLDAAKENPDAWNIACGIEVLNQALTGIHYAHKKTDRDGKSLDIVHMDLSPHNLMISREGDVKILDFGISKAIYENDQKAYHALRGTYAYMSPEQCREEFVDHRSDIFTLGIMLYELTTLRSLFSKQPSEFMIFKAITEGIIPPPSNIVKNYPPELEFILYKALEVNPLKRFQSARQFTDSLEEATRAYNFESGSRILSKALENFGFNTDQSTGILTIDTQVAEADTEVTDGEDRSPASAADARPSRPGTHVTPMERIPPTYAGPIEPIDPEEQLEAELAFRRHRTMLLSLFAALMLAVTAGFGIGYTHKVGDMEESVGSRIYVPEKGRIFVETDPPGAVIFLDMKKQEKTSPALFDNMPLNRQVEVEAVLPGYESVRKDIKLSPEIPMDALLVEFRRK